MRLLWTGRSHRDLVDIAAYIARDSIVASRQWIKLLRNKARQAATHPRAGRVVAEFGRDDIREAIQGNYRIVYRIVDKDKSIHILTVFEGHRMMPRRIMEDD